MKYALGNMLNGAGGLNPDKLSLDLQFATDKTLTARKGPTPVLTRANATATFIGSDGLIQTAIANQARFDHDPDTLVCKGLLLEEQRTNLVFPSAALTTQTRTVTAAAHTLSFYGTGTIVLSGVHVATVTGTGAYPTRTTLTFTPAAGSLILTVTGSVTQAQLEAGAFVTSYIPTTTGSAVRSADACSITGANFTAMYNQSEGAFFVDAFTPAFGSSIIVSADNNGTTEVNRIFTNGTLSAVEVTDGTLQVQILPGSIVANTAFKLASAYKLNDFAACRNGGTVGADTNGTLPTPNQLKIGYEKAGNYLCGCVASLRYYKKRLSDAKIQTLTDSYDYTTSGGDFYVKSSQGRYSYL
jgi:hypothetical protein